MITKEVEDDVQYCISALEKAIGVEVERPLVLPAKENRDNAAYDRKGNIIYIGSDDIGDGNAYFEEAAHCIRERLVQSDDINNRVDEFFGRLGESMGRELVKGIPYERLFENCKPRNFSDLESHGKRVDAELDQADKIREIIEQKNRAMVNSYELYKLVSDDCKRVLAAKRAYDKDNDTSKFRQTLQKSVEEFLEKSEGIGARRRFYQSVLDSFSDYMDAEQEFYQNVNLMVQTKILAENSKDEEEKEDMESEANHLYRMANIYLESLVHTVNSIGHDLERNEFLMESNELVMNINGRIQGEHFIGYICAELYAQQNPNFMEEVKELFRKPKQAILRDYIREELFEPYQELGLNKMAKKLGITREELEKDLAEHMEKEIRI